MKPAQIDRIEGEWAVVFIEGEKQPMNIRVADLPEKVGEGDYLLIEMQDGEVIQAELDLEGKAKAEKRIQDKLDRLRRGNHLKDWSLSWQRLSAYQCGCLTRSLAGHSGYPALFRILDEEDDDTIVYDHALSALGQMGAAVVDILLERIAHEKDNWQQVTYATILGEAGQGDSRAYDVIRAIFDRQRKPLDIELMASNLLTWDLKAGTAYLQSKLKTRRYSRELRATLEGIIEDAHRLQLVKFP